MPWGETPTQFGGLKGRESSQSPLANRVLAAFQAAALIVDLALPGHWPAASALGSVLPARWAGEADHGQGVVSTGSLPGRRGTALLNFV